MVSNASYHILKWMLVRLLIKRIYLYLLITILIVMFCITSCANNSEGNPQPEPYFPVQAAPTEYIMLAPLRGELVIDNNGYLRVKRDLILWPYGFSVKTADTEVQIVDDEGKIVGCVGQYISLCGGYVPDFWAEEKLGHPLPEGCEGPYFLMGKVSDLE